MSLEICGNHGQPYTTQIIDGQQILDLDIFPSFGLADFGKTSILLPNFYSPKLNNSRNIPVYLPPSVIQNKETR